MATTISIKVGSITATRTFADDAKSAEALRLYAELLGVTPEATNKEKLQYIVDRLVETIRAGARKQRIVELSTAIDEEAAGVSLA
jgi:hypothetical protein